MVMVFVKEKDDHSILSLSTFSMIQRSTFQPIPYNSYKSYTDYLGPEAELTKCSHPPCPENDANIHDQDDDDNNDENPGGSLPPSRPGCPPSAKHQRPSRSHCQALLHGIFIISLSLQLSLSL